MPRRTLELLEKGVEANRADAYRRGNIIECGGQGQLIIAGDVHGHRRNFERIVSFADLGKNPNRHLILQEIIHGGQEDDHGGCLSFELLLEAIELKLEFPDRVHIIMSNHDTAFITNSEVIKAGEEMNRKMRVAIERRFGSFSEAIQEKIARYLLSQPLAVRAENGLWVSHSLPGNRWVDKFDAGVFEREVAFEDCRRGGQVYLLTWGRKHKQQALDKMAELLGVDLFVCGHQEQEFGCGAAGENLVIVNSEHNHGCLLQADLDRSYGVQGLLKESVSLASIC